MLFCNNVLSAESNHECVLYKLASMRRNSQAGRREPPLLSGTRVQSPLILGTAGISDIDNSFFDIEYSLPLQEQLAADAAKEGIGVSVALLLHPWLTIPRSRTEGFLIGSFVYPGRSTEFLNLGRGSQNFRTR
jgi:hypothetical protein